MSKRTVLVDAVCAQRRQMRVLLAVLITMGLFTALSALFVGPGDRSFPILVIDAVLVVGGIAFFAASHWYCTKRAMED